MYKKVFVVIIGVFLAVLAINSYPKEKYVLENNKTSFITDNKSLAMMFEIKAESGEYQASNNNTWPLDGYVFNTELSKCERGSNIYWDYDSNKVIMESNTSDKCYVYFDKIPVIADRCTNQNMATCMMLNYELDENLYYHDVNLANGVGDNSYRYSGANPNNYVCFGSDAEECPIDNLYRIIGIFDGKLKLLKYNRFTSSYWGGTDTNNDNTWSNSTLNTQILNNDFLNSLESKWRDKITNATWYVGGFGNGVRGETAAGLYNYEIKNSTLTYNAYVGLVYVSDYGFAADSKYWNLPITSYNSEEVRSNNWIFDNSIQWTISRQSDSTSHAFFIDGAGLVFGDSITLYNAYVKPTFYLDANVLLVSGIGTFDDPYRIG